mmetsp:Transcript_115031/g.325069  ORF Transcript_115031/g.325069 Transcript_115031/m.325069 type:complete len:287 (-) Transcript_115031:229-1089(-)
MAMFRQSLGKRPERRASGRTSSKMVGSMPPERAKAKKAGSMARRPRIRARTMAEIMARSAQCLERLRGGPKNMLKQRLKKPALQPKKTPWQNSETMPWKVRDRQRRAETGEGMPQNVLEQQLERLGGRDRPLVRAMQMRRDKLEEKSERLDRKQRNRPKQRPEKRGNSGNTPEPKLDELVRNPKKTLERKQVKQWARAGSRSGRRVSEARKEIGRRLPKKKLTNTWTEMVLMNKKAALAKRPQVRSQTPRWWLTARESGSSRRVFLELARSPNQLNRGSHRQRQKA